MASGHLAGEIQRNLQETADELARLRADSGPRIPPEDFDRYRARATELRAEAIRHLLRLARLAAAAQARDLFHAPADDPRDAPARR